MPEESIKHIVVLMLENRSFDHMLGDLQKIHPKLDGIDPQQSRENLYAAKSYRQTPGAGRIISFDPRHEYEHVMVQIQDNNSGFVRDFADANPHATEDDRHEIMRYHSYGTLKSLHTLAEHFLVCDHWYAPVPGPTWPNRLFAMSGTSLGRISMPQGTFNWDLHWYDQATIFDRLNEKGKSWKLYYGDFPLSFLLVHQWEPRNVMNHHQMTEFYRDAAGNPDSFPDFAFIEPAYLPPGANDDHPPHDVIAGETLIANVYNAIRENQTLWNETLLVVLCDEHGGFYDHEPPVPAVPPDYHQEDKFPFTITGIRVPALLISPWVLPDVLPTKFDHTSLLKYMIDKWHLGQLGNRTAVANTFASHFQANARSDTPARLEISIQASLTTPPPLRIFTRTGLSARDFSSGALRLFSLLLLPT
jgi:phospholipase C